MKYRFINGHRHGHAVRTMCRVLRVSSSGFYDWLSRPLSDRAIEDQRLLAVVRASHTASGGVYGYLRVHLDLQELGERCGKHRVARLMKVNNIKAIHGYKIPRGPYGRPSIIAPYKLQREFTVGQPDQTWVTDITYIRTWQGWLYLAVVMDLFARKVVGWSMKPTLARELVQDAILMAVWRRRSKVRNLLEQPDSPWWDNQATSSVEGRQEIFTQAFIAAVAELQDVLGKDPDRWTWGDLHTVTFRNQSLGESGIAPVEALFNRGPFRTSAGSIAVNATGWNAAPNEDGKSYQVRVIPSERMIVDLRDLQNSLSIISTGQSGHAYHPHYIDKADLWRNIQYHPMYWERAPI